MENQRQELCYWKRVTNTVRFLYRGTWIIAFGIANTNLLAKSLNNREAGTETALELLKIETKIFIVLLKLFGLIIHVKIKMKIWMLKYGKTQVNARL